MEILLIPAFIFLWIFVEYRHRAFKPEGRNGELHFLEFMESLLGAKREVINSLITGSCSGYSISGTYRKHKVQVRQVATFIQIKIISQDLGVKSLGNDMFRYKSGSYICEIRLVDILSGKVTNDTLKKMVDVVIDETQKIESSIKQVK